MDVEKLAKKHGVSVDQIKKQLEMGTKVEHEHTSDDKKARKIAMDHLEELPDYYTRLKKMEEEGVPTNAMGLSSSSAGPVQTYDPFLGGQKDKRKKKIKDMWRRMIATKS